MKNIKKTKQKVRTPVKDYLTGGAAGVVFVLATAWLFYDMSGVSVILLPVIPAAAVLWAKNRKEKRLMELNISFKDGLQYMKNAISAGYSAEKSIHEAGKGLKDLYGADAEITREFRLMEERIKLGFTVEQVFSDFAKRSGVKDIKDFSELFAVVKRTGGDIGNVIHRAMLNLTDKIELKRELKTEFASKAGEFRVMCIIPHALLLYLKLCSKEMSEPLYHNLQGEIFMTVVLLAALGFFALGNGIIKRNMQV